MSGMQEEDAVLRMDGVGHKTIIAGSVGAVRYSMGSAVHDVF